MALGETRQLALRKHRFVGPATSDPSMEIPSFLKQGPRVEEPSTAGTAHIWIQQLFGYMSQLRWKGPSTTDRTVSRVSPAGYRPR
jgi:hypothetical protein